MKKDKKKIHVMTPWLRLVSVFGSRWWCDYRRVEWVCGRLSRQLFAGLVGPVRFHASTHRLPQSHRCKIIVADDEDLSWYSISGDFGVHPLHLPAEAELERAGLGPGDTIYIAAEIK